MILTNDKMNKFFLVKEIVDQYDFDGLLDWGGSIGEYDKASATIGDAISEDNSVEEIATTLLDVFNTVFGFGHDLDSCLEMAMQIKAALICSTDYLN